MVTDASGRRLPARVVLRHGGLDLVTDTTGARYPLRIDPVLYTQAALTITDGAAFGEFGRSVAVSGTTIAVGAPGADVNGNIDQGAVYVFTRAGGTWHQAAKLTATDGATGDDLGLSVAISGATIAAGADDATGYGNPGPGAVYVFTKPASGWADETQAAKLTAAGGADGDELGWSVGVSDDTVAAGAWTVPAGGGYGAGAVYVFTKPTSGWADETQATKLTGPAGAPDDALGYSVAVSGTTIAAGAPDATVNGNIIQGAVYVFTRARDTWTRTAKLTATSGAADDGLGISVAVSGTTIAAGAPDATVNENYHHGAVYVFSKPVSGWADETQSATLTTTSAASDSLGWSVALSGATIAAGAPFDENSYHGAAYAFTKQPVTVSTHLSAAKITAGGHVHDTAALTGATVTAGGTMNYRYYPTRAACRADAAAFTRGTAPSRGISAGTVTVTHATVPRSHNIRFGRARTWYWAAFYSGDTGNNRAASNCGEKLTVTTPGG